MTQRRWLITGCSSGLGRALAEQLAIDGEQVLVTARDVTALDGIADLGPGVVTAPLDVTDDAQCATAVELATERFGGLDVLVNNAGYGQFGVVEEVTDAEVAAQFDTNVYGPWRLLRHVLPHWRAQGGGHAIFSSSVSGVVAFPGLSAYTASKFALDGLAEALAAEAGSFGVKVTILQLGGFATSYGDKVHLPERPIDAYRPVSGGMLGALRGMVDSDQVSPPALFADAVRHVAGLPEPPLRLPVGPSAFALLEPALVARQADFEAARGPALPGRHAAADVQPARAR
ncbi:SDR family oxidoreductase [Jidongwangia harbinensis]|uniref:SDR family oxidoreductase n=1 Tax=Jidongwangia harbinensis TaxID=2878561 RepID=UPI001CDA3FA6|nr:SDR family oxidoreductase [Jidongwangia harbinensis]MCA2213305.1 SDR family oxidoreductase [Jidongwangia harbinensis]